MKPIFPKYVLQSLQGHLPVAQYFVLSLKIFSDFALLILLGINSHNFGARGDILSVPKQTVRLACLCIIELFLRLYGFSTK